VLVGTGYFCTKKVIPKTFNNDYERLYLKEFCPMAVAITILCTNSKRVAAFLETKTKDS